MWWGPTRLRSFLSFGGELGCLTKQHLLLCRYYGCYRGRAALTGLWKIKQLGGVRCMAARTASVWRKVTRTQRRLSALRASRGRNKQRTCRRRGRKMKTPPLDIFCRFIKSCTCPSCLRLTSTAIGHFSSKRPAHFCSCPFCDLKLWLGWPHFQTIAVVAGAV